MYVTFWPRFVCMGQSWYRRHAIFLCILWKKLVSIDLAEIELGIEPGVKRIFQTDTMLKNEGNSAENEHMSEHRFCSHLSRWRNLI